MVPKYTKDAVIIESITSAEGACAKGPYASEAIR